MKKASFLNYDNAISCDAKDPIWQGWKNETNKVVYIAYLAILQAF